VVLAYSQRANASEWLRTHYDFQIRTFWISLVAGLVGVLTLLLGVGFLVLLALAVWIVVRAVIGLSHITSGRPHPNPTTWLV
jgi:uncharacterized membrane protein